MHSRESSLVAFPLNPNTSQLQSSLTQRCPPSQEPLTPKSSFTHLSSTKYKSKAFLQEGCSWACSNDPGPPTANSHRPGNSQLPGLCAQDRPATILWPGPAALSLSLAHGPLSSGFWAQGFTERRRERGGVTGDLPRVEGGQRGWDAGLGCLLPAQSHPTAATEERERGPGRTKRVSAAATAAAGTLGKSQWTESSPPTPDSGELLQTMRLAATALRTSSSLLPAESPAPTREQRGWRLAAVVSCGTGIRGPHDRRGNSAESSSSASLPRTAQLLAALYNFLPCPNLAPRRRGASLCSLGC